jgi:hypothetical protein
MRAARIAASAMVRMVVRLRRAKLRARRPGAGASPHPDYLP